MYAPDWLRRTTHAHSLLLGGVWALPAPYALRVAHGIILTVVALEGLRLGGILPNRIFLFIRPYEHRRPASYAHLAFGWWLLSMTAPRSVALAALALVALLDPLLAVTRRYPLPVRGLLGAGAGTAVLLVLGWSGGLALAAIAAAMAFEHRRWALLDDDLVMQLAAGLTLWIGLALGVGSPPDLPWPKVSP